MEPGGCGEQGDACGHQEDRRMGSVLEIIVLDGMRQAGLAPAFLFEQMHPN